MNPSRNTKLVRFLAIPFLALTTPLYAALITSFHAEAELPFGLGSCNLTSDAPVSCQLPDPVDDRGGAFARADTSAIGPDAALSISVFAGSNGFGSAAANA